MQRLFVFALVALGTHISAFKPSSVRIGRKGLGQQPLSMNLKFPKFLPALLGSAFLIFNPADNANALPSGGRASGSSFRSSPSSSSRSYSTRSYSGPSVRSYSSPAPIIIAPSYGYSPFGFSPFGYGGFAPPVSINTGGTRLLLRHIFHNS